MSDILKPYNLPSDTMKLLKDFKVDMSVYLLERPDGVNEVMLVGGIEVLHKRSYKDSKELLVNAKDKIKSFKGLGYEDTAPYLFIEGVNYSSRDLEELLKWKSKLKLTKTEFEGFGDNAESSALSLLENKIVYIHEKVPSTNSLSLAKQFGLLHKNVIQDLFKIAESNPSVLTGIEFKGYNYTGNKSTLYATYLEVSEDVYYMFLENMGTPKSKEMRALRTAKRREYFTGFQKLRDLNYSLGFKESEIKMLIGVRTEKTKGLMNLINSYAIKLNDTLGTNRVINPVTLHRIFFNVINAHVGLDAVEHKGERYNRKVKDETIQKELLLAEHSLSVTLNGNLPLKGQKTIRGTILEILSFALMLKTDDIIKYLTDYDVILLLEEL